MIAYPLLLDPIYDKKIWGGRRLETGLGKSLPDDDPIGESLESGDDAVVLNGRLAGKTLKELVDSEGVCLLGSRGLAHSDPFGDFPLLVKFIDASGILSLQAHPNDEDARALGKRGKTEAWYVVQAEPGSNLITGLSVPATAAEVRQSVEDSSFERLLERVEVSGGESLIVSPGTMHAIGAGVLLYEVQQNCDVTFRLYDWGRVDAQGNARELHLDQALATLRSDHHAVLTEPLRRDEWREILTACRYFVLERWTIDRARLLPATENATFRLLTCISGELQITALGSQPVELRLGETVVLPADLTDTQLAGSGTVLCSYIPDLTDDVVRPLKAAGYSIDQIEHLAGDTGDIARVIQGPQ